MSIIIKPIVTEKVTKESEVLNRFGFFVNKKEINIVASTPIPYEYFEIDSYNEYLDALNNSKTTLFWMSSSNIKINEDFNFNKNYDINQTHAFIHRVAGKDLYNGLFLCSKNNTGLGSSKARSSRPFAWAGVEG